MSDTAPTKLSSDQLRRQAYHYAASKQWPAAQAILEGLVQKAPLDAHTRLDLAGVIFEQGRMQEYNEALLSVAHMLPDDAELIVHLVRRLFFAGEIVAARTCLDQLERLDGTAVELAQRAQLRWMLGEIESATTWIERAITAGADTPNDHYLHAMLLQFTGRLDKASTVLDAGLHRWPGFGDMAVAFSSLCRQTAASNHIARLRELSNRISSAGDNTHTNIAKAGLDSALFKELDDLGRYDEAWRALASSNALMHSACPYDSAGEEAVTDALIRTSQALKQADAMPTPRFEGPIPIFIVGMPRSGTTLLDRMLSNHTQVVSAGEINDFRRQLRWMTNVPPSGAQGMLTVLERCLDIDFAHLGRRYLEQTQWRAQGRRYYIDKLPINVRMVPFIRRALPHAPILHLVRNPMDTCFSNLKAMLGPSSPYSYDMESTAHYYRLYARLTQRWHETMPGAMLDVSYASLVKDTEATMIGVLTCCGLELEYDCLQPERNTSPVATPSSTQVREPIYAHSLGEWQHYAEHLNPLWRALAFSGHLSHQHSRH